MTPPDDETRVPPPSVGDAPTFAPDAALYAETLAPSGAAGAAPDAPPGYVIEKELGRGGMGVVYLARQTALNRLVALKMILSGSHAGEKELARFRAEAETVAALRHPNVVQIYEVGAHGGRPFMALEYCAGGSLDRKLAGTPLPPRDAAELAATLARALHAAHDQGIVHRDLKPANVLLSAARGVAMGGATPQAAIPKVTDFGLAKRVGSADGLTATGAIMGTPSYMAPEQAKGDTHRVGPAADTYALGAMLYEFLTGRPPFRAATALDTVLLVVKDDPVPPSRLAPKTPRDLETICLKCLQKDPARRYPTAAALADDLERWLNGEPITARPVGVAERAWKWVKRNRGVTAAAAAIALALLIGMAAAWQQAARADRNAVRAIQNEDAAKVSERVAKSQELEAIKARDSLAAEQRETLETLYAARIGLAQQEWAEGITIRARQLLDLAPPEKRGWEYDYLRGQFNPDRLLLNTRALTAHIAVSPDGSRIVTLSADAKLRVWDTRTGVGSRAVPADGRGLAIARDGRIAVTAGRAVVVFDPTATRELARSEQFPLHSAALAWSADEKHILVLDVGGRLHRVAATNGHLAESSPWSIPMPGGVLQMVVLGVHPVFSPDRKFLAQGGDDQQVRVWNTDTGQLVFAAKGHARMVGRCAFSPDGKHLASPGGGAVLVHAVPSGELVQSIPGDGFPQWGAAYSPDGKRLAVASRSTHARVYDLAKGEPLRVLRGHAGEVSGLAFTPDGARVVTGSFEGNCRVWDATSPVVASAHVAAGVQEAGIVHLGRRAQNDGRAFFGHMGTVRALAFSPDGRFVASAAMGDMAGKGRVVVWNLRTGEEHLRLPGEPGREHSLTFTPDGKALAVCTAGTSQTIGKGAKVTPSLVALHDATTGEKGIELKGPPALACAVRFRPDGREALVWFQGAEKGDTIGRYELPAGREPQLFALDGMSTPPAYLTGGREFAVGMKASGLVRVHDASTGAVAREWPSGTPQLISLAAAGGRIAAGLHTPGDAAAPVQLWDEQGKPGPRLDGHVGQVSRVAFSPDGARLFTAGNDFSSRVWKVDSGREVLNFRDHRDIIADAAWSPDGSHVGTAGQDGVVRVWSAPPSARSTAGWETLHNGDFATLPPPKVWEKMNGNWTAGANSWVGTLTLREKDKSPIARLRLLEDEIPRTAEVTAEVEVSAPMLVVLRLIDPSVELDWAAFVTNKKVPFADIGASLVASNYRFNPPNVMSTTRPAALVVGKRHEFRLVRDPERLRLFLDGVEVMDERLPPIDLPRLDLEGSLGEAGDTITIHKVEVRAPRESVRDRELRAKAEELFRKEPLRETVREQMLAAPGLSDAARKRVPELVDELIENPFRLRAAALGMLHTRPGKAELELARKQMEAAGRLVGLSYLDGPSDAIEYAQALALARHLTGDKAGARDLIARVVAAAEARTGAPDPFQLALLALAERDLGNKDAARAVLVRMRDIDRPESRWRRVPELEDELEAAKKFADELAPRDPVREAVHEARLSRELAGWLHHKLDEYMAGRTPDSVDVARRTATPGPHDVWFDRKALARIRRLDFFGPAATDVRFIHDHFATDVKGDAATVRCRSVVIAEGFTGSWEAVAALRKVGGAWKIARIESWPTRENATTFDPDHWQRKDAAVVSAKTDAEKLAALVEARRWAEAMVLARRVTTGEKATADDWDRRRLAAYNLGDAEDAAKAAREAHKRDPKAHPLPPWAKE